LLTFLIFVTSAKWASWIKNLLQHDFFSCIPIFFPVQSPSFAVEAGGTSLAVAAKGGQSAPREAGMESKNERRSSIQ
jgi:hypothetical protein